MFKKSTLFGKFSYTVFTSMRNPKIEAKSKSIELFLKGRTLAEKKKETPSIHRAWVEPKLKMTSTWKSILQVLRYKDFLLTYSVLCVERDIFTSKSFLLKGSHTKMLFILKNQWARLLRKI